LAEVHHYRTKLKITNEATLDEVKQVLKRLRAMTVKYLVKLKCVHAIFIVLNFIQNIMITFACQLQVFEKKYEDLKQELEDTKEKRRQSLQELDDTKEKSRQSLQELSDRKASEIRILKRDLNNVNKEYRTKLDEVMGFIGCKGFCFNGNLYTFFFKTYGNK
jgi:DNA repair exonuclease SbcCD ATPase subunit